MSHKLYDITLYYYFENDALKKQFALRQNVVSALYVYFLDGYKPPKTTRISITLKDKEAKLNEPIHFGSILNADALIDRENFWAASVENQKQTILDTIHKTTLGCAAKLGWNKEIFNQAYTKVKEANYVFKVETNSKLSPDRKTKAKLEIEKLEEKTIIRSNFYNSEDKLLMTIKLFESFNHEMFYERLVRNFKWFNNKEFGVYLKNEELKIIGDISTAQSKTIIEPKQNSREAIEGILRYILYRNLETDKDIVEWANK
jgi:hypothetical protein